MSDELGIGNGKWLCGGWGWLYNGKGKGGMDRFHPKKFFVGSYEI